MNRTKKWIEIINVLSEKYGLKCWYCGLDILGKITIDHIVPKVLGGKDEIDNIALICGFCNRAKLTHELRDYLLWLSHIRSSSFSCPILEDSLEKDAGTEIDRLRKDFWS